MEGDRGAGAWENRRQEGYGWWGGEKAGSGIPKVAGTGRKGEKFCNIAYYFTREMEQRGGNPYRRGWEKGVKGTGGGSFRPPISPHDHVVSANKFNNERTNQIHGFQINRTQQSFK